MTPTRVRPSRGGFYAGGPNPQRDRAERRHLRAVTPAPPEAFDARRTLRRSGIAARDEGKELGQLAGAGARGWSAASGFGNLGIGEFVIGALAAIVGLALLDTALRGRGPAGVERLLGAFGAGTQKLVASNDVLFGYAPPRPATPIVNAPGSSRRAPEEGTRGASTLGAGRGLPGAIIGRPHQGTHTQGNWQSDNAFDVGAPKGTPIYAPAAGVLQTVKGRQFDDGDQFNGYQLTFTVPGDRIFLTHLSRLAPGIVAGAVLRPGQLLGYSGVANGAPHLHAAAERGSVERWLRLFFNPAGR